MPDTAIISLLDLGTSWNLAHVFLTSLSTCSSIVVVVGNILGILREMCTDVVNRKQRAILNTNPDRLIYLLLPKERPQVSCPPQRPAEMPPCFYEGRSTHILAW